MKRTTVCRILLAVIAGVTAPAMVWSQTFKDSYRIPLPVDPSSVAAGDLNGDGIADFVWIDPNPSPPTFNVLLSQPNGGWLPAGKVPFPTVTTRTPICLLSDVNNDKKLDLVCADANQDTFYVHVFPGNGDGTFQSPVATVITANQGLWADPILYPLGDLNGDGFPDFYAGNAAVVESHLILSDGRGGFKSLLPTGSSANYAPIYAADVNGDGIPDLLYSVGPEVALGNGDGTFAPRKSYAETAYYAASCIFHDMDGDGHLDAVCGYAESITGDITGATDLIVLHGNADGSFNTTPIAQKRFGDYNNEFDGFGTFLAPVAVADVNGDGVLDVLGNSGDGLAVVLGSPGLTFNTPLHYARAEIENFGGIYSFYLNLMIDVNGDGLPDTVDAGPNGIYIGYARGDGTFASAFAPEVTEYIGYPTVADFNGDGIPDIAATGDTSIKVSFGKGDGTFDSPVALPNNNGAINFSTPLSAVNAFMVHGDFNGDGKVDLLAVGSPSIYVYQYYMLFGNGDGTFKDPILVPGSSTVPQSYAPLLDDQVVDINGDGKSDIFGSGPGGVGTASAQIAFSLSNGDGSFRSVSTTVPASADANSDPKITVPAMADFNGDGRLDAAYGSVNNVYVVNGHGDGTFDPSATMLTVPGLSGFVAMGASRVAAGDLDGDGNQDIAVLMQFGTYLFPYVFPSETAAWAFYGDGKGGFSAPVLIGIFDRNYYGIAVKDLNRDTRADVVVKTSGTLGGGTAIGIIESLPGRTFGPEEDYTAGTGDSNLAIADLNRDGWPDLVVGNGDYNIRASSVTVLMNLGSADEVSGTLVAVPEPSLATQPFTLKATLIPPVAGSLTGNIDFSVDGNAVGTAALTANAASLVVAGNYAIGQHTLSATWSGNASYQAAALYGTHTVVALPTAMTLASSANPATAGTSVTFTATVSSQYGTPSGTVTFTDGTVTLGTATLTGGIATYTTSSLAVGTHAIGASYAANGNFAASSASLSQVILGQPSQTVLSATPNPAFVGQAVTLSAAVSGMAGAPTGTVSFTDGATVLGSASVSAGGVSTLTTTFATAGVHHLIASYGGDSTFNGSASRVYDETILLNPTAITVSGTPNPAVVFQTISFTAQMTSPTGYVATGTVTFFANGTPIGTGALQGGKALFSTANLAVGTYAITASYGGSAGAVASTSPPITLDVVREFALLELTSSLNPAVVGDAVTFTAKLTVPAGAATGSIQFYDGTAMLGTAVALSGQTASLTTNTLSLGVHPITAAYSGDANVLARTSVVLNQSIVLYSGDFSISASPQSASVYTGQTAKFQVTVQSMGGFNEPLSLTTGAMPAGSSCLMSPDALSGGKGSSTLTVSTSAPHRAYRGDVKGIGNRSGYLAETLAGVLFVVFVARRRRSVWLMLLATCAVLALGACGTPAPISGGTPPGKYTITISAAFSPGGAAALTHSTTVELDVKSLF